MTHLADLATSIFCGENMKPARVGVIALAPTGRCLSLRRAPSERFPLTWGQPGGGTYLGEAFHQAARREFWEETGGVVRGIIPLFREELPHITLINFLGFCDAEFTPVLDDEHIDFQWVRFTDWPRPAIPGIESIMRDPKAMALIAQHTAPHYPMPTINHP